MFQSKARHHAISAKMDKPFLFDGNPLIVQYEVKFQNGQECGGAYIKLLSSSSDLNLVKNDNKRLLNDINFFMFLERIP